MDIAKMIIKNFSDISEWIKYSSELLHEKMQKSVSFHVDDVDFIDLNTLKGDDLLKASYEFLRIAKEQLSLCDSKFSSFYPIVVIPLGYSENIEFWNDAFFDSIGCVEEPASIYLCESDSVFNLDDQEYRCRIYPVYEDLMVLYRCHRSFDSYQKDWEFSKDIYLLPI
ncbi:MAG: hypothetical protein ABSB19_10975 [Methylomonas sp.]|jgi:hypothetical protein